jgi:voltage-gated potassium channel
LLYLYLVSLTDINIISGILLNLFCAIVILWFKNYTLFLVSLITMLLISYRYYLKKRDRMDTAELLSVFVLNLVNIFFSIYELFEIMYCYPSRYEIQKYIPFTKMYFIEFVPIIYVIIIYCITLILILSVNNHMSIHSKNNAQFTIIKTTIIFITIVLLVISVNAIIYFIIHNFPYKQFNGIFDGNFLKDPINSYHRLTKSFSDCLWFSATTFFTVGYGDMHPVGNIMYLLSMMEMISAYILGIIMIPILLFKVSNN